MLRAASTEGRLIHGSIVYGERPRQALPDERRLPHLPRLKSSLPERLKYLPLKHCIQMS